MIEAEIFDGGALLYDSLYDESQAVSCIYILYIMWLMALTSKAKVWDRWQSQAQASQMLILE